MRERSLSYKRPYSFIEQLLLASCFIAGIVAGFYIFMSSTPALYGITAALGLAVIALAAPASLFVTSIPLLAGIATSATLGSLAYSIGDLAFSLGLVFAIASTIYQGYSRYTKESKETGFFQSAKATFKGIGELADPEYAFSTKRATPAASAIYQGMKATDFCCTELGLARQFFNKSAEKGMFIYSESATELGIAGLVVAHAANGNSYAINDVVHIADYRPGKK